MDETTTECEHLWMLSHLKQISPHGTDVTDFGACEEWQEHFYCQRNPEHRLMLVDGKVQG